VTKNFLANAESPSLGPLVWLLFLVPTGVYLKLLLVLYTAAGLTGMVLLLRELGVGAAVSLLVSIPFAFGGFFVAHLSVGHPWAMGGQLLPLLLLLYRRAARGSGWAVLGAAALNASAILAGQHQPFIWQNLLLAAYALAMALQCRSPRPLVALAAIVVATTGLAAVKLLPMIAEFASYDPSARTVGLPSALLLTSLAAGGQGPDFSVTGLAFAHGSGWWEYAFYVGPVGLALLAVGPFFARRELALLAIAAFFLLLALDLPLWAPLAELPVWRTQRSPSRFVFLALFCVSVVAAIGLENLWRDATRRAPRALAGVAVALSVLSFAMLRAESQPWQRAAVGPPLPVRDHRPHPLRLEDPGRAVAELREFAPNRLVYRVDAQSEAIIGFPFRQKEGSDEWRVDGLPAVSRRGKLAVEVPPGERDVVMVYRPEDFHVGALITGATLLAITVAVPWRIRSRRR
jgi:hypothetical protein